MHLIDIEKCFILEIKTDIENFSNRRTTPISGQYVLYQRCPLIGENAVYRPIRYHWRFIKNLMINFGWKINCP